MKNESIMIKKNCHERSSIFLNIFSRPDMYIFTTYLIYVGTTRRKRTCSTSASISTEREPIIRTNRRTIYTAGRPPWYNKEGQHVDAFVIGVCGGSASGKTTVAKKTSALESIFRSICLSFLQNLFFMYSQRTTLAARLVPAIWP